MNTMSMHIGFKEARNPTTLRLRLRAVPLPIALRQGFGRRGGARKRASCISPFPKEMGRGTVPGSLGEVGWWWGFLLSESIA